MFAVISFNFIFYSMPTIGKYACVWQWIDSLLDFDYIVSHQNKRCYHTAISELHFFSSWSETALFYDKLPVWVFNMLWNIWSNKAACLYQLICPCCTKCLTTKCSEVLFLTVLLFPIHKLKIGPMFQLLCFDVLS